MKFTDIDAIKAAFRLPAWSDNYFVVTEQGELAVQINEHATAKSLVEIINHAQQKQIELPLLIRFPQILHHRITNFYQAFAKAIQSYKYNNEYECVYPIKVNQERQVVATILNNPKYKVGLEVGSKAELITAMIAALNQPSRIIINGYKDVEMIRLGCWAELLGHSVIFIIEKRHEVKLILEQSATFKLNPILGVRLRLTSVSKGHWQNTGGSKSKFGLTTHELLSVIEELKNANKLNCLQLLHCHLGSQVSDLEDLIKGAQELVRNYIELRKLELPIEIVDVGGGLAVDYEGKRNNDDFSMNYSVVDYADVLIKTFTHVCEKESQPHPKIISEFGRAMTAHHAVFVTDVVNQETSYQIENVILEAEEPTRLEQQLDSLLQHIDDATIKALQPKVCALMETIHTAYLMQDISLTQKAKCEQKAWQIIERFYETYQNSQDENEKNMLNQIREQLAQKWVCNFSLFQSLPDIWSLNQTFPIMPIANLLDNPIQDVLIQDITCDSDGRIDHYVTELSNGNVLPIPVAQGQPTQIAFFLVGAYQEILGDKHNLFGDAHSVDVTIDKDKIKLSHAVTGDSVQTVIDSIHFDVDVALKEIFGQLKQIEKKNELMQSAEQEFTAVLKHDCYLNLR